MKLSAARTIWNSISSFFLPSSHWGFCLPVFSPNSTAAVNVNLFVRWLRWVISLIYMCVCVWVWVCTSGYRGTAVLQRQVPALENLTDLHHHPHNPSGGKLSSPWILRCGCWAWASLDHIGLWACSGPVKAQVSGRYWKKNLFQSQSTLSLPLYLKTTHSDFCLRFQFRKPLSRISRLVVLN